MRWYGQIGWLLVGAGACTGSDGTGPGPGPVASVDVAPDTARLVPGGRATFTATPRDADGTVVPGRAVAWTVGNQSVASVSTGGVVTANGTGTTAVTAVVDGKSDSGVIVVNAVGPITAADDFERIDGPLGPNWVDQNGNLAIQSGEVGMVSLGGSSLARWGGNAFGPDQFSEVVVGTLDGNTFDFFRGLQVYVRMQLQGTAWRYGFHYFSNTRTYQIKYDGGPSADTRILAETGVEPLPVPGDRLRIEMVGSTIRCYVNDQLTLQATDGALSGGAIGFVIGLNPGSTALPRRIVASWSGGER